MDSIDFRRVACEFARALRGKRSQRAASRRLGYASNVWAEWESGRRIPTALDIFRACAVFGLDVSAAFDRFGNLSPGVSAARDRESLARWMVGLRGERSILQLARLSGLSRHQVSRLLSGTTQPRLHEFFRLVSAGTGRLPDLVSALVDIRLVPTLTAEHDRITASRALSFEQPWSSAVLAALDALPTLSAEAAPAVLAQGLGLAESLVAECIKTLCTAGVVRWTEAGVRLVAPSLVDTGANPEGARKLRQHWSQVAAERSARPGARDLFSYNVFSVSRADYQQLRTMQRDYYRRVRELIADSPPETAALLNLQLIEWELTPGAS